MSTDGRAAFEQPPYSEGPGFGEAPLPGVGYAFMILANVVGIGGGEAELADTLELARYGECDC